MEGRKAIRSEEDIKACKQVGDRKTSKWETERQEDKHPRRQLGRSKDQ